MTEHARVNGLDEQPTTTLSHALPGERLSMSVRSVDIYILYIYWKNRRFQTWIQIVAPKQTPELAPSISSAHFILSCCNFQTFRRFETQQEHPCLPCQLPCNCGLYVDGVIWSRVKYNS